MKKSTFVALLCVFCFNSVSQSIVKKQTLILLSNVAGVPFKKDPDLNDLIISGFEVDVNGNFYFFGGEKTACFVKYSGKKQLFRTTFNNFPTGQLYFYSNKIFTFSYFGNNKIRELNSTNGLFLKENKLPLLKHFNSFLFSDSSLVLEFVLDKGNMAYQQYNLSGQYIKQDSNAYNIESMIIPPKEQYTHLQYIGKWDSSFVFWQSSTNSHTELLMLVNPYGRVLQKKYLPENFSGACYAENPDEHRKVRNGKLFVLGRKGKFALITEVPLESFFTK